MKELKVAKTEENQRLDLYLAFKLPEYSRSQIKKHLNEGLVKVNAVVEYKPNYRIKSGDEISIDTDKFYQETQDIVPEAIPLDILYEDQDLVVINKPAGMVVHPATANWQGTLMNALLYRYKNMAGLGDKKMRFGLIHRLDKDTSGLILVGKSNLGLWHYSKQFAERHVEKVYLAIVAGDINKLFKDKPYEVQDYLGRNPKNRKKFAVLKEGQRQGRLALTRFEFLKAIPLTGLKTSLVRAIPKTGRTHQIRVHLSKLGYPIIGDPVYGGKYSEAFPRLLLHAWKLSITMVDGTLKTFTAKPPKEFGI